ncbi:DUF4270 domain-containing protein [Tamlana sp. 2_MG-2023]|uniref:DUF4270 domain-containing protein n=1 Tax=unclassified Tamlana TaxID=2614803 RepID=UPI0026E40E1C|nr:MULTISPECIES: DUF4270 domain-containing protein [unclassified Tamlana]MDO6760499.1 DUF4270 domain-containing protein [Tamlana sp. 2_MG-2023]MDO6790755.1 DUF4270 domain-containing protein [Tamlana sp. 1_MG-2023]
MKKTINSLQFPVVFLLLVSAFIACDKDYSVIESDVLGDENADFDTKDSLWSVTAYNKKLDSLQINNLGTTSSAATAGNLLGVFNDPSYGLTTASIVSQIAPTSFSPEFGENPVIDSVVLNIPYYNTVVSYDEDNIPEYKLDSLFGNSNTPIELTVYRSNYYLRDFDPNNPENNIQNYYSNGSSPVNSALNGSSVIKFDDHIDDLTTPIYHNSAFIPSKKVIITTVGEGDDEVATNSTPALREKLDEKYWKEVIIDKEGDPVLSSESNFKNYFRGLYFKAEATASDGSMILLNIAATTANITIHYTSGADGSRVQDTYVMNFSGNILNTFINDYTIPLTDGDKTLGDDKLYLKGVEGSMAVVELFSGKVDCDGDGILDLEAIDCFKQRYRQLDDNGDYIKDPITNRFQLKKLINEAQLVLTEEDNLPDGGMEDYHTYDRIYAYNIKSNATTLDYSIDPTTNTTDPLNSKIISLGQRNDKGVFKIRLTQHLNNILFTDSIAENTPTTIGLVLSNNVNYTGNAEILDSGDDVTAVPRASILSPRGTIIYGSSQNVADAEKRLQLKIFSSEAKK